MTESSTTESSTTAAGFGPADETATADLPAPRGGPAEGPAVAIRGLGKRFGDVIAVKGIDLDVPRGSFFGLVGPNGAGKTTTLSMVTGLLRPTVGQAFVLGRDVWADPVAAKRLLGILPDGLRTFDRLTGLQLITYAGLLRGMARELAVERATELVNALGLASSWTSSNASAPTSRSSPMDGCWPTETSTRCVTGRASSSASSPSSVARPRWRGSRGCAPRQTEAHPAAEYAAAQQRFYGFISNKN